MQCAEVSCCERELKHSRIYGDKERWCGRDEAVRAKLKRTEHQVRKAVEGMMLGSRNTVRAQLKWN